MTRIFEYGFLWVGPEMSLYGADDMSGSTPAFQEDISKGLSVMLSIMMATEKQATGGPDAFYPKFRTFWPRESFD